MTEKWELVTRETNNNLNGASATTARLKVPGGWLYRIIFSGGTTMTFVPEQVSIGQNRLPVSEVMKHLHDIEDR